MENITCDPSIYTMNHPKFIVSYQVEEPIILAYQIRISEILPWDRNSYLTPCYLTQTVT